MTASQAVARRQTGTTPALTLDALGSLVQPLRDWDQVSQTCPALTRAQVDQALAELERALIPIDVKTLVVLLDRTLALWRAPNAVDETAEFYVEALEEFPAAIVELALKRVRLTHRYPTAPAPADFRAAALAAATPLRGALVRARLARMRLATRAEAEQRWHNRTPLNLPPLPTAHAKRIPPADTRETDLGNIDANLARWAQHEESIAPPPSE